MSNDTSYQQIKNDAKGCGTFIAIAVAAMAIGTVAMLLAQLEGAGAVLLGIVGLTVVGLIAVWLKGARSGKSSAGAAK